MSSVIEEILTSTIGFVIAMVILGAIIGVGLYGYWVYANHVTLENYLWPIAEVLPYQGGYLLAIVNTGNEPFYVEQVYLKGGSVITPSQAVNPSLNWCSVANTKLMHNQWWCGEVNKLPVAVRICSALNPSVCIVAPVHGWQVATFSQPTQAVFGVGNGLIEVVVNDPYGAGWSVTWSYSGPGPYANTISYSMSKSTSYTWFINPPYVPIQITFSASITQNPTGYACQVVPSSVTNTYNAGSVQAFNVTCSIAPITVSVSDPYNAGWSITWSGAASGSQSGSSSTTFTVQPSSNNAVTFTASITSTPSGYTSCSISPQSTTANPGQTVKFTVSCSGGSSSSGSVTMTLVINDNPGVLWTAKVDQYISGAYWIVWQQSGSSSNTYSVNLASGYQYAIFMSVPSGCTASGSPVALGSLFTASSPFTETVTITCQSTTPPPPPPTTYGCLLTVQGQSNPSGIASVSVSPTSAFVPSGQSQPIGATAPLSTGSGADWYEFDHWSYSLSGPGSVSLVSTSTKSGNAFSTWQYMCPSGLTRNVTATLTIIANYDHDYIYLSGPTTISQGTTTAQYTLSWSVAPGSASQVQWSASVVSNFAPAEYQVSATLYYTEYGASLKGSSSLQATLSCTSGTPYLSSVSINPPSQSVSGSSGSATATVTINWQCNVNKGQPQ